MPYFWCKLGRNRSEKEAASFLVLPAHALLSVHVSSKSVSKEGPFTHEAETVFRRYVASHRRGVIGTSYLTLASHAPRSVAVWSKSVGNGGQFTLEAERVSRPYLASFSSEATNHHTWHSRPMIHDGRKFGPNRSVTMGYILLRPKEFFVRHLVLQRGDSNIIHHTPSHVPQSLQVWSKLVSKEG
jgi:hypothetical protein